MLIRKWFILFLILLIVYVIMGGEDEVIKKVFFLKDGEIWSDFFIGGVWLIRILFEDDIMVLFLVFLVFIVM